MPQQPEEETIFSVYTDKWQEYLQFICPNFRGKNGCPVLIQIITALSN